MIGRIGTVWLALCVAGLLAAHPAAAIPGAGPVLPGAASVTFSPASLAFGAQQVGLTGTVQMVTLTNATTATLAITNTGISGANAPDFAEMGDTCANATLPTAGTCSIGVNFTPQDVGNRTASLVVTDTASDSPQSVSLAGVGARPAVSLSASDVSFGTQQVDTSGAPQMVTLTNSSQVTLTVTGTLLSGANPADFDVTDTCSSTVLPPTGTCGISLSFTPTDAGQRIASLEISDSAPDSPQSIALSGDGAYSSAGLSATSLDFGAQQVGATSSARSVTVSNNGSQPLNIDGVAVGSDGDFAETDTCAGSSLAPDASCAINVTFTPIDNGERDGSIVISDDAADSPQIITVTGNGFGLPTATPMATVATTLPLTASLAATTTLTAQAISPTLTAQAITPTVTPTSVPPSPTAMPRATPRPRASTRPHRHAARERHTSRHPHRVAYHRSHRGASERGIPLLLLPGHATALTIGVHTRPRAHIIVTIRVMAREWSEAGSGRRRHRVMREVVRFRAGLRGIADARGHYTGHVYVTYQPRRPERDVLFIDERTGMPVAARRCAARSCRIAPPRSCVAAPRRSPPAGRRDRRRGASRPAQRGPAWR